MFDCLFRTKPKYGIILNPDGTYEAVVYNKYGEDFSIDEKLIAWPVRHRRFPMKTEQEAKVRLDAYKIKPRSKTIYQE